jgi:hypothetical protein
MTNHKGDYGCITFADYDTYMQCLHAYRNLGWVDDELALPGLVRERP